MFENFQLQLSGEKRMGYQWDSHNPHQVVCIIHGIGEYAGRYDRVASAMADQGIAVLSVDLPGHGLSPGKRGHCSPRSQIFLDIDNLLEEAQNRYPGLPLVLYGHSMGGNITLDYRRKGRLRELPKAYIVTSPWIVLKRKTPALLVGLLEVIAQINPQIPMNAGIKQEKLGNKKWTENQPGKELLHNIITLGTALDGFHAGEEFLHTADNGKKLLLMHGSADYICDVVGSREFARIATDCEYVEWPGYYHELHNGNKIEDGSQVIDYMIRWIKEKA